MDSEDKKAGRAASQKLSMYSVETRRGARVRRRSEPLSPASPF